MKLFLQSSHLTDNVLYKTAISNMIKNKRVLNTIMFIVACMLSMVFFFNTTELKFYNDQTGPLSLAVYFAGNNWSDILSAGYYYGFGYYFIYFWIFKLTTNYHIIFFTIIVCDSLICAATSLLILWFVSTKILKQWCLKGVFISFIAYSMHIYWVSIMNEKPSFVIIWLCVFFICKLLYDEHYIKWTILLALLMGYAISVHERLITLPIAIILVSFIFRLFYRKRTIHIRIFIISFGLFFIIERLIRNIVLSSFFSNTEAIQNTTVINTDVINYFSPNTIGVFVLLVLSNFYKIVVSTYGVGIFALVLIFMMIKKVFIACKNKNWTTKDISVFSDENIDYIFWFFLVCIGMTVVGLAFNQSGYVGYCFNNLIDNQQCYKSFFYYRYYSLYLGPIFVIMFTDKIKKIVNKNKLWAICGLLLGYKLIIKFIYPYINKTDYIGFSLDFSPVYINLTENSYQNQLINSIVSFILVLGLIILFSSRNTKNIWLYLIIAVSLIFGNVKSIESPKVQASDFDIIFNFMEENYTYNRNMDVYCTFGNQRTLQFVLSGNTIKFELPEFLDNNDIVFTKNEMEKYSMYPSLKMDDGTIIYCNQVLYDIIN